MTDPNQCESRAWSSHLSALLVAIAASKGPVLELGVGHFSTPELHALCGALNRHLVSVEDNIEWSESFSKKYSRPEHQFFHIPYDEAYANFGPLPWGVTFIDHSPGGANRAKAFWVFRELSDFVVVHDYHLENSEAIAPFLKGMNYHVTTTYQPPTLIASRKNKIPESLLRL